MEYKVDGDCVVNASNEIVYDDMNPRAANIIAELLTYRDIIEEREKQHRRAIELLIKAGHVSQQKVDEAYRLAKSLK